MCKTWPFMDELLEKIGYEFGTGNPIVSELRHRYDEHGMEYATELTHGDIPINACMNADTLKDIQEELIDAIFNMLVLNVKYPTGNVKIRSAIGHIISAWYDVS